LPLLFGLVRNQSLLFIERKPFFQISAAISKMNNSDRNGRRFFLELLQWATSHVRHQRPEANTKDFLSFFFHFGSSVASVNPLPLPGREGACEAPAKEGASEGVAK
jgi:hypothetical protein